jgi:uncharacterized membrane protein
MQPVQQNSTPVKLYLPVTFLIISFLGFLDATYLTIEHYTGGIIPCTVLHGCQIVTTSKYSVIFGVPIALGGSLYYLTLLIITLLYVNSSGESRVAKTGYLRLLGYVSIIGFIASLWLLYIQAFELGTFCLYCVGSALSSTLLFIIGMVFLKKVRK